MATAEAEPIDRERLAQFSTASQVAGHSLLDLVDTILDVASIESGRVDLASDPIDIARMAEGCACQAAGAVKRAGVTLETTAQPGLPWLRRDERRLRQVMAHQLMNAVEFIPRGGRAFVAVKSASDDDLLIRVADSGVGIAEEYIGSVLEPFSQLDTGLARRVSGAGLGFYLCRAFVQAHGGHLTLDSKPGEGTAATVRLRQTRLRAVPIALELVQEQ